MRRILPVMVLAVLALATSSASRAEITYPWCAQYGGGFDGGGRNCGFWTLQQCMATVSGVGGHCEQNFMYRPGAEQPRPPRKPRSHAG